MSELTTQELPVVQNLDRPMTVHEVMNQSLVVHNILTGVMTEGIHFGKVPGTDKPTLLQPGAEKICVTFRLAPKYDVEDLSEPHNNFFRYRVKCSLYTIKDSYFVGSAIGEASSGEEKFQWERAVCQEHWDATDPTRRRIKFRKDDRSEQGFSTVNQVQRNAADLANTVLKIAAKRAMISATRGSTAASDLLEVDLDEEAVAGMVAEQRTEAHSEKPAAKPKAKPKPAPVMPFGRSKGKQINDPDVPTDDLIWMKGACEKTLDDPARAKYKTQSELFIAALGTEIEARQTPPQTAGNSLRNDDRPPMEDSAWVDFKKLALELFPAAYSAAMKEWKIKTIDQLPVLDRWAFYDLVNKLTGNT